MTKSEVNARTKDIEDFIRQNGGVTISDLAKHLHLSTSGTLAALRNACRIYEENNRLYFHDWRKSV